ncbi:MAG: PH domain-containing protein [Burkholderiaceae bacterium]|nr:PH domain-containing protein [Burkholderiaceae bacterium]
MKATTVQPTHEHEWEAAPGLPAALPAGETLLWQGSPDWRQLALHAFHLRKVGIYFAIMLSVQTAQLIGSGHSGGDLWRPLVVSGALATLALGLLTLCAWFAARSSLYTVTSKRVVMRIGIVLTVTFNLPFRRIAGASSRHYGDDSTDIALQLYPDDHIGWFHLWPHQRAWHVRHPQPTLRCLPDGQAVGELLLKVWRESHQGESIVTGRPRDEHVPHNTDGVLA